MVESRFCDLLVPNKRVFQIRMNYVELVLKIEDDNLFKKLTFNLFFFFHFTRLMTWQIAFSRSPIILSCLREKLIRFKID